MALKARIRNLSPAEALGLLGTTSTSSVNRGTVEDIKDAILSRQFVQDGTPIKIGKNGEILDGLHRLVALSEMDGFSPRLEQVIIFGAVPSPEMTPQGIPDLFPTLGPRINAEMVMKEVRVLRSQLASVIRNLRLTQTGVHVEVIRSLSPLIATWDSFGEMVARQVNDQYSPVSEVKLPAIVETWAGTVLPAEMILGGGKPVSSTPVQEEVLSVSEETLPEPEGLENLEKNEQLAQWEAVFREEALSWCDGSWLAGYSAPRTEKDYRRDGDVQNEVWDWMQENQELLAEFPIPMKTLAVPTLLATSSGLESWTSFLETIVHGELDLSGSDIAIYVLRERFESFGMKVTFPNFKPVVAGVLIKAWTAWTSGEYGGRKPRLSTPSAGYSWKNFPIMPYAAYGVRVKK